MSTELDLQNPPNGLLYVKVVPSSVVTVEPSPPDVAPVGGFGLPPPVPVPVLEGLGADEEVVVELAAWLWGLITVK